MEAGPEQAIQWIVNGLLTDGAHHKQWYLERALIALGVSLEEAREALSDYYFEEGVPA
jgi:hypothetical protein